MPYQNIKTVVSQIGVTVILTFQSYPGHLGRALRLHTYAAAALTDGALESGAKPVYPGNAEAPPLDL